jgi:hypothetical protein
MVLLIIAGGAAILEFFEEGSERPTQLVGPLDEPAAALVMRISRRTQSADAHRQGRVIGVKQI